MCVTRSGVDGISLLLVLLTTLIMPLCVLASWKYIQTRVKEFMVCLLIMETAMIGVFCALDFVLFFIFWEAMLIPMALLIGIWGGPRRVYAAVKFFIYTMSGSVLLLVAIIALYVQVGSFSIPAMMGRDYAPAFQCWVFGRSSFRLRSRCRCCPSTPGCRRRMSRRPPRAVCCWPACF
jgi:NADH-quinone oxidoreductase subunit M